MFLSRGEIPFLSPFASISLSLPCLVCSFGKWGASCLGAWIDMEASQGRSCPAASVYRMCLHWYPCGWGECGFGIYLRVESSILRAGLGSLAHMEVGPGGDTVLPSGCPLGTVCLCVLCPVSLCPATLILCLLPLHHQDFHVVL